MKFNILFLGLIFTLTLFSFHTIAPELPITKSDNSNLLSINSLQDSTHELLNKNVYDVLSMLGAKPNNHELNEDIQQASPLKGEEIFTRGNTTNSAGQTTDIQSKYFVCTSCHNNVIEDPDLSISDPQKRLEYAKQNDIPFLQGTTVYGITNRSTFYNGSYYLKYGKDLVEKANKDIREAIQLCAVGCAQGRSLDDWEIESVLSYFWTLQFKMKDLNFDEGELDLIGKAQEDSIKFESARKLIRSKYVDFSPATFVVPPADRKLGYNYQGNPENGKDIYEISCLHCHKDGRYSYYYLDQKNLTLRHLRHHFPKFTNYSSYQVIRWGTHPLTGKKAYMPQYTKERMSNQQVEDLRSYFEHPY